MHQISFISSLYGTLVSIHQSNFEAYHPPAPSFSVFSALWSLVRSGGISGSKLDGHKKMYTMKRHLKPLFSIVADAIAARSWQATEFEKQWQVQQLKKAA